MNIKPDQLESPGVLRNIKTTIPNADGLRLPEVFKFVARLMLLSTVFYYVTAECAARLSQQPEPATQNATIGPPVSPVGDITQLAHNHYLVPGGGCNTVVFVMERGVLVVDTKYAPHAPVLLDRIREVTDKPVTHVINTHSHPDHTMGNIAMPSGTEFIVHSRTAENMTRNEALAQIPVQTFRDRLTLFSGAEVVDLYHFGPAHTGGDILVVFRAAGVMHAGDIFKGKRVPVIVTQGGGGAIAYGETMSRAVAEIQNVTHVVTGHGPVSTWQDFTDYGEFVNRIIAHARTSKTAGKDVAQAMREFSLPPKYRSYDLKDLAYAFKSVYVEVRPWWHFWYSPLQAFFRR